MTKNKLRILAKMGVIFVGIVACVFILGFFTAPIDNKEALSEAPAATNVVAERLLVPGGHSVGVRMDVKGVLVVGLEDIKTVSGEIINPGVISGLEIGDTIIEINGTKVYYAEEVQKIINEIKSDVKIKVQRKDEIIFLNISPVISAQDGYYRLGVWVKDKTAGIGTLTFYDYENGAFGALGHAITDPETGSVLPVDEGELLNSSVESVKEGKIGSPGELRGIFYEEDEPLGNLLRNTELGVFGNTYSHIENPFYSKPISIAYQDQIEKGPAHILTTLSGNKIERFEVEIVKVNKQTQPDTKGLVIKVTDKDLLERCGGIIQGMSGSPIIQNDKIVGAITHVFVKRPDMGYGVFIEWMIDI